MTAVALEGFRELAKTLRKAAHRSADRGKALESVARSYLAFARRHPALYQAMFTLPTGLRFAEAGTRPELKDGFAALASVVSPSRADVEVATETFRAALHGLAELERSGRIRRSARDQRIALVVHGLLD